MRDDPLAKTVQMVPVQDHAQIVDTVEDVRRRLAELARWLSTAMRLRPTDQARTAAGLSDLAVQLEDVATKLRGDTL